MLSTLSPDRQQFLTNINRIAARQDKAQREVSSGLKLAQVSDNPDQVSELLTVRASLATVQQTGANLVQTKAETDSAESALQTSVTLFDRVQSLAAEGTNSTQTADSRATIAQELGSILQQLGGIAGTQVEGRYVFSGDSDQIPPYTIDLTKANPISAYQGSATTRVSLHPNGTSFPVAETAQQIFDSADPTTNVFQSIQTLRNALTSNNDTAIQNAQAGLAKVSTYLNSQLAFYGTVQNKVSDATDFGKNLETQLKTQISSIQDADLTESILNLTQAQTQQQAALQAQAKIPRTTLFDFLG
jgi:flagellar hook-associated protein 3 FlgL